MWHNKLQPSKVAKEWSNIPFYTQKQIRGFSGAGKEGQTLKAKFIKKCKTGLRHVGKLHRCLKNRHL